MKKICGWVNLENFEYIKYHNEEWGKLLTDDTKLFECLVLEGAQSGLSWEIILKKREDYRKAFFDYNLEKIIKIDEKYIEYLLEKSWIVRHKLKILSVVQNAKIFQKIIEEFGNFYTYLSTFTGWKIFINSIENYKIAPTKTELSEKISKDLKKRWMKFVWPTIMYSFLQAVWIVDDHENDCFCKNPF